MDAKRAIVTGFRISETLVGMYLGDLTDGELLVRAVAGANHIAWQLGHLINTEQMAMGRIAPGAMPALPEGWKERYGRGTAASDDGAGYLSKAGYVELMQKVRAGTMKVLEGLSEADLDREVEGVPFGLKTVGELLVLLPMHWNLHAGQWVVTRRKLGRAPLF